MTALDELRSVVRSLPMGPVMDLHGILVVLKWRLRHQPELKAPDLPLGRSRKDHTVYQCPDCEARQIGSQFCDDCHSFMRRLGAGGTCPSCAEPLTFEELLDA